MTDIPRPQLDATLAARARAGPPTILAGPPGAGKTTALLTLRRTLAEGGWLPVYLDLMGAASSPERFVVAALEALPAEPLAARLAEATRIRALVSAGRLRGAEAVHALFGLWATLDSADGRPVALLLDEPTEIRSLAYFSGLREVASALAAALLARRRGTLLATSFSSLARRLWPGLELVPTPPLGPGELEDVGVAADTAAEIVRGGFGWPAHVRILLERSRDGQLPLAAWTEEMAAGGRLERSCAHTYEKLLLRSRGYGISKAVLAVVAEDEGLNLSALVPRIGRTPGATRDYLRWLVDVDALRVAKKRYFYVDGLLRHWVRLHATGRPPRPEQLFQAAREAFGTPEPPAPQPQPHGPAEPARPQRRDALIEID